MKATMAKCRTTRTSASNRSFGIRAPLAPGAGVEPAAGQARGFHGEQVVAGGDARAAVVHDLGGRASLEEREKFVFERLGRLERSVGREVVGVEAIGCA